jgi:hypothetical protein
MRGFQSRESKKSSPPLLGSSTFPPSFVFIPGSGGGLRTFAGLDALECEDFDEATGGDGVGIVNRSFKSIQ